MAGGSLVQTGDLTGLWFLFGLFISQRITATWNFNRRKWNGTPVKGSNYPAEQFTVVLCVEKPRPGKKAPVFGYRLSNLGLKNKCS